MEPGLYIVGTPIGNLGDITVRALDVLRDAAAILTEDTRHTGILLARHGIRTRMVSCHKFNEASRVGEVVARIGAGEAIALVSNAGMPGVSDPGSRMVAACREAGLPVTVVPGASAVTSAIALSGFGFGGGFVFEGFLPRKPGRRRKRLELLAACELPIVLFESPFRVGALLEDLAQAVPGRRVFLGRELTKKFEECLTGLPAELQGRLAGRSLKGEFVLVVAPPD